MREREIWRILRLFASASLIGAPHALAANPHTVYANLGARFEANRGQADPPVQFLSRANGYTVLLSPGEATIAFGDGGQAPLSMRFGDLRKVPAPQPSSPASTRSNVFVGRDPSKWLTDIPNYEKIIYPEVYPGVDLVFHGTRSRLEYDFIVAPGADPAQIHFLFPGAQPVLDADGLRFQGNTCDLRLDKPAIWQETAQGRIFIPGGFVLNKGGQVTFKIAHYDRSLPLVIDPTITLVYATFLGGSSGDMGENIAVDPQGNAYVTGIAQSADFPVKSAYQSMNLGVFVTKFNLTGTDIFYSTFLGPSDQTAIAVDSAGNAYLAVTVEGMGGEPANQFPTTSNAFEPQYSSRVGSAIVKLSPAGNSLLYSTFFEAAIGGLGPNVVRSIAADNAGNVFVTGYTGRTDFPVTANAYQTSPGNLTDNATVVARINTTLSGPASLAYASYFVGNPGGAGWVVATDGALNAYVGGQTRAGTIPTRNAFQPASGGSYDAFVAKFNTGATSGDTSLVYASYLGGSDIEAPAGIAADSAGNVYVGGFTSSTDFPVSSNAYQNTLTGGESCFVAKIVPSGSALAWSTYFGLANNYPAGMDIDASGNVYIAGRGLVPLVNAMPGVSGPAGQFVATLSSDGSTLLFSSAFITGATIQGIAVHPDGDLYVTGLTLPQFVPTPGAFQTTDTEGFNPDGFVVRIGFGGTPSGGTGPQISANGVVNAGSFIAGPVAPGELISIFGSNLGPQTLAGAVVNASGGIDTSLAGVSVIVGGLPAVMLAASSGQVNVVMPFEIAGSASVAIQLTYNGMVSNTVTVPVSASNPGLFTTNFGSGPAAALNQDGTTNSSGNPAQPGSVVSFYWTGGGVTSPASVDGLLSVAPYPVLPVAPTVTIGGLPAQVSYAGAAPGLVAGVLQLNAQMDPSVPSGAATVSIQTQNGVSQAGVAIAVGP